MPFHVNNVLADELDIHAAGTVYSDVQRTAAPKIGDITQLILEIWSPVDAVGEGTATITLQTSSDNFSTDTTDVLSLPAKDAAALAKGKVFEGAIPSGLKEDFRLKVVTATGFTTAKLTAALRNRG
jgi:hypothetical protein